MARALRGETLMRIGPERLAEIQRGVARAQVAADETETPEGGQALMDLSAEVARVFATALAHSADIQRAVQVVGYAGICVGYGMAYEEMARRRRSARKLVAV